MFEYSNNSLIETKEWLVARKCFQIEGNRLIAPYERVPYDTWLSIENCGVYLQINKKLKEQCVKYQYKVITKQGERISAIDKFYDLGYHASLLEPGCDRKYFCYEVEPGCDRKYFCYEVGSAFWLPIAFDLEDIQMINYDDVVVSSFCVPLISDFYFELADIINVEHSVVITYWLPIVSAFMELLKLNKIENRNE